MRTNIPKISEREEETMKRNTRKLKLITVILLLSILCMGDNISQAALQANKATHDAKATKTGAQWIEQIRQMEATGQTMGLNEDDINEDLSPKTSNNIDVHMMRTTEYGAVAILSASGFGNPKKLSEVSIKSSTGNVTGVYMGDRDEWTAGVCSGSTVGKNKRYYDLYSMSNTSAKVGDALGTAETENKGCAGWHGSEDFLWFQRTNYAFRRGINGIFSFYGWGSDAAWIRSNCGRGVAVIGSNF